MSKWIGFTSAFVRTNYSKLSGHAVKVLGLLMTYIYDHTNTCVVTERQLAELAGVSLKTVQRAIAELLNAGIVQRRGYAGRANRYWVNPNIEYRRDPTRS